MDSHLGSHFILIINIYTYICVCVCVCIHLMLMIFKEQICAFLYGKISQNEKTKIYGVVQKMLEIDSAYMPHII